MESLATYLIWIDLALVALATVLGIAYGFRSTRLRRVKPVSQIVVGLLPFLLVWGVVYLSGVSLAALWALIATAAGAVVGALVARGAKFTRVQDRVVVKPSGLVAWLSAVAWIVVAAAVGLLGPNAVSASLLIALLSASMSLAETIVYALLAKRIAAAATSAAVKGAETPVVA